MSKPKVIKEFDKLDESVKQAIFAKYPYGFDKHIITFKNHKKALISALPFETEEFQYMVKMTRAEANQIVADRDNEEEEDNMMDELEEITPSPSDANSDD